MDISDLFIREDNLKNDLQDIRIISDEKDIKNTLNKRILLDNDILQMYGDNNTNKLNDNTSDHILVRNSIIETLKNALLCDVINQDVTDALEWVKKNEFPPYIIEKVLNHCCKTINSDTSIDVASTIIKFFDDHMSSQVDDNSNDIFLNLPNIYRVARCIYNLVSAVYSSQTLTIYDKNERYSRLSKITENHKKRLIKLEKTYANRETLLKTSSEISRIKQFLDAVQHSENECCLDIDIDNIL